MEDVVVEMDVVVCVEEVVEMAMEFVVSCESVINTGLPVNVTVCPEKVDDR